MEILLMNGGAAIFMTAKGISSRHKIMSLFGNAYKAIGEYIVTLSRVFLPKINNRG